MSRVRLSAAAVVSVALLWALVMLVTGDPQPPVLNVITAQPESTTTEPDFEALVETQAIGGELDQQEELLTEEAHATTTTTSTTSTTSTTAPTTRSATPNTRNTPSPPTTSQPSGIQPGYVSSAESDFAGRINSYRSSNGKASLSRNGSLDSYARSWAKKLAERGSLAHSNIGSLLPPWSAVAENVGSGGSVGGIFDALVGSSGHRSNMLGDYTDFGIGVYRDSSGRSWTAHVFTR